MQHQLVVVDTTKVQFFKQITTLTKQYLVDEKLLLIPQRYNFSSKSQRVFVLLLAFPGCCWYHKGTIFQANHNSFPRLFKFKSVVVDTTKVQFFKQITTNEISCGILDTLLLIPQRYNFSSKSQQVIHLLTLIFSCCWYHKGTIFQANHNNSSQNNQESRVVVDTTKVQFFKQITTMILQEVLLLPLLLIPQRYNFSSKSQLSYNDRYLKLGCCWYHKGTIFQANHNGAAVGCGGGGVAVDTTKVRFFKQNHKHVWG